jgi:hypothetical protein
LPKPLLSNIHSDHYFGFLTFPGGFRGKGTIARRRLYARSESGDDDALEWHGAIDSEEAWAQAERLAAPPVDAATLAALKAEKDTFDAQRIVQEESANTAKLQIFL